MPLPRPQRLLHPNLPRPLLHAHQHDVHQPDPRNAQRQRPDKQQQHLQPQCHHPELRQLLHDVRHVNRIVIGRPKPVVASQFVSQRSLNLLGVTTITEPDPVQVLRIFNLRHRAQRHIYNAIQIVVALLHLCLEHTNDLEAYPVQPNCLPHRIRPGKQLRLRLGTNHRNMRPLHHVRLRQHPAFGDRHVLDQRQLRRNSVHLPRVRV